MVAQKRYIIFAGINGVGKTTFFRSNMWNQEGLTKNLNRVNSDEIIAQNSWEWTDSAAQIKAGKIAVELIRQYLVNGTSFNQETTLAGRSIMQTMTKAKALGYCITLYYIGVEDPEIANQRIAQRIDWGGHGVDPQTVRKRAKASMDNLVEAVGFCDEVFIFDNTFLLRSVAKLADNDLVSYETGFEGITWPDNLMRKLLAHW